MDKIQTIEKLFNFILILSYLVIPIISLLIRKKSNIRRILTIYGLFFFGLLIVWDFLPSRDIKIVYQYFYTISEYLFFAYFLWSAIQSTIFKRVIVGISAGFIIFQLVYYLSHQTVRLDSIPIGVETILLLIFIVFFFYEYFNKIKSSFIINHYCFWISVGIMIYLGGSFFFNILAEQHSVRVYINDYWYLTYIGDIIKNLLFIIAIIVTTKNQTDSLKQEKSNLPYLDMI